MSVFVWGPGSDDRKASSLQLQPLWPDLIRLYINPQETAVIGSVNRGRCVLLPSSLAVMCVLAVHGFLLFPHMFEYGA